MANDFVLWGPPVVPSVPGEPRYERDVRRWVGRCQGVGVTKMITGAADPVLVDAAHEKGIDISPYVDYTAFPSYGSRPATYGWSLAYLRPPVESPEEIGRAHV